MPSDHPLDDPCDDDPRHQDLDEAELDEAELDEAELDEAELDEAELDEAELELDADPANLLAPVSDPVGTARRRHGGAGAILAAGMFGLDIALGRKPKEDAPVVVTASGEPGNIDADGIEIPIDEATSVFAPPQPPVDPFPPRRKRR